MGSYTKSELSTIRRVRDAANDIFELAGAMRPELREELGLGPRSISMFQADSIAMTAHRTLLDAGEPAESPAPDPVLASRLAKALRAASFPAEDKDWGPEWARQWKAGHFVALELLDRIAAGHDLDDALADWANAAENGRDTTPTTRAESGGSMLRFSWKPLEGARQ